MKEDIKDAYQYKVFPQAGTGFPSPGFIFLHGITRNLILFPTPFPVFLQRLNRPDSLFLIQLVEAELWDIVLETLFG